MAKIRGAAASSGGGSGIGPQYTVTNTGTISAQGGTATISTGLSAITRLLVVGGDTPDDTGTYRMVIDYDSTRNKNKQMAVGGNSTGTGYGATSAGTADVIATNQTYATVISEINGGNATIKAPNSGWWSACKYFTWYAG